MFAIMKTIQGLENGRAENEFKISARRVLELATIEGARSMGIDDKVGSLKAGKRADIIMIDTRAANLGVFGDPAVMLVTAVQPANVDTVMVDGRILKRNGKLTTHECCADRQGGRGGEPCGTQARQLVVIKAWTALTAARAVC